MPFDYFDGMPLLNGYIIIHENLPSLTRLTFFLAQMTEDTEVLVVSPQYNADIAVIMVI